MEPRVFRFSEEAIKERKNRTFLTIAIIIPVIAIFTYFFADLKEQVDLTIYAVVFAVVAFVVILETLIVSSAMFKRLRSSILIIDDNKFERRGGKFIEEVYFERIRNVTVKRDVRGKILLLKVQSDEKTLNITGFEEMEIIFGLVASKMAGSATLSTKQYRVDWNNPLITILLIIPALAIVLLLKLNFSISELTNTIILLFFGIVLMLYRPISKNSGKRFKTLET
ncbi:MAG: hypothetical protein Q8920_15550, partial [Bacillota bacterium]|nr:hypothetical protein [Bacillota bacterium]